MNAFQEGQSESVCCNAHLYDSSHLRQQSYRVLGKTGEAEGWRWQDFHRALGLGFWMSYKQLQWGLMAHFMTYFV